MVLWDCDACSITGKYSHSSQSKRNELQQHLDLALPALGMTRTMQWLCDLCRSDPPCLMHCLVLQSARPFLSKHGIMLLKQCL